MRYKGLNSRQSRFVDEYIFDLNGTNAAIRAGYSKTSAATTASEILTYPNVQRAVQMAMDRRAKRVGIKLDRVLEEEKVIAFSDIGEIFDFTGDSYVLKKPFEIPEHARRAVQSMKVKTESFTKDDVTRTIQTVEVKLWSKDSSLGRVKDHLGVAGNLNIDLKAKVMRILLPAGSPALDERGLIPRESLNGIHRDTSQG